MNLDSGIIIRILQTSYLEIYKSTKACNGSNNLTNVLIRNLFRWKTVNEETLKISDKNQLIFSLDMMRIKSLTVTDKQLFHYS